VKYKSSEKCLQTFSAGMIDVDKWWI